LQFRSTQGFPVPSRVGSEGMAGNLPAQHSRLPLAWHDQRTALGFA
jgi:hypothetical protein